MYVSKKQNEVWIKQKYFCIYFVNPQCLEFSDNSVNRYLQIYVLHSRMQTIRTDRLTP